MKKNKAKYTFPQNQDFSEWYATLTKEQKLSFCEDQINESKKTNKLHDTTGKR